MIFNCPVMMGNDYVFEKSLFVGGHVYYWGGSFL